MHNVSLIRKWIAEGKSDHDIEAILAARHAHAEEQAARWHRYNSRLNLLLSLSALGGMFTGAMISLATGHPDWAWSFGIIGVVIGCIAFTAWEVRTKSHVKHRP